MLSLCKLPAASLVDDVTSPGACLAVARDHDRAVRVRLDGMLDGMLEMAGDLGVQGAEVGGGTADELAGRIRGAFGRAQDARARIVCATMRVGFSQADLDEVRSLKKTAYAALDEASDLLLAYRLRCVAQRRAARAEAARGGIQ